MKPLSNLRRSYGNYLLNKRIRHVKRQRAIRNFTTAKSACIIFQCKEIGDFSIIKTFREYLEGNDIRTYVIGYVHAKQIPDQFLLRTGFNCFSFKDLNLWHIPMAPFLQGFEQKEFDLLLDLCMENHFPVRYLSRISRAKYKIGQYTEDDIYDLMIDIGKEKKLAYFCEQVRHYLGIIRSSDTAVPAGSL